MYQYLNNPPSDRYYTSVHDISVKNNLSVTPSDMLDMTNAGVAVSTASADAFFDGDQSSSFDIPREYTRGYDAVDAFNYQSESRSKVKNVYKDLGSVISKE